ncbi:MAG: NAD-glutamate dehydrogenase [Gammaproteobacteria bacterium]
MHAVLKEDKKEVIERVVAKIRDKLPDYRFDEVSGFARSYYALVAQEDLAERDVSDLYGATVAHWNFIRQRTPGVPKIRIYNPQFNEHGWQSTHTVVELVTDDMPFLVDSVRMELNRHGFTIHLTINVTAQLRRDPQGKLTRIFDAEHDGEHAIHEAIMHVEIDRQTTPQKLLNLGQDLTRVVEDVRQSVEDWPTMRERLRATIGEMEANPPLLPREEIAEAKAFLEWLDDSNFTFLGCCDFDLITEQGQDALRAVPKSGLGILRYKNEHPVSKTFTALPPDVRRLAHKPELLVITKSNSRSTVHRAANMDYIGIKRFDTKGKVRGEHRFVGLYTSAAYHSNPSAIPVLRRKVAHVLAEADLDPKSHAGKALLNILDTYPRDDLFQASQGELFDTAIGILQLQERQRTRLFVRPDPFQRFVSCLVFVPRERFNTSVRQRMREILKNAFNGTEVEFNVQLSESALARLEFTVRTTGGRIPQYDLKMIEAALVEATQTWEDHFVSALLEQLGEESGLKLFNDYANAFPAGYRERFSARTAVHDIQLAQRLHAKNDLVMTLYRPLEAASDTLRFKLYRLAEPTALSDALPMLENMGVRVIEEHTYEIEPVGCDSVWVHDFGMTFDEEAEVNVAEVKDIFQDTFGKVWRGEIENDGFNRLVLSAKLDAHEINVLRAYCRFLLQSNLGFSQAYMEQTMAANPGVALLLVELFRARFDPALKDKGRVERLNEHLLGALDAVTSLDEDRILRSFLHAVRATVRTNFFQKLNYEPKPYLSLKFDSEHIPELPQPRPLYEIFVYSARTEGIHLRGGKVARGGIRWSDRREDFRTEVLGLMKAQMVKNAVIVPVGAKGGFIVKKPPEGDRAALLDEVEACYRILIRGLLDLTDNRVGADVVPPLDTVRYDDDDPYLVVAADKGTASFSDIANDIARECGFWLGDAFASGGSTGYDHKKMGITARGAWESVKHHFRAMSIDIQATPFTVVGIGDMSGDVFGNGMLLSPRIKLLAAFDHRHIFLDPDPDPARSFEERKRLFELARSSWADYDKETLSTGGAIEPRTAKSISLSPQIKQMLGVEGDSLAPNELIRTILKMRVHLLWNGGVGTYIKATEERDADVGDRGNDAVRINASDLRCQVVGEGGNLGLTQLARIEFARLGGRVDADFVHNAGGVDSSDHEVNIKILLNHIVANGDMTIKHRNQLLAEMTDEVAELVLLDNYYQTHAISIEEAQAPYLLDEHQRFMRTLERAGKMDKALEFLPNEEQIAERQALDEGLTRPEIAVLVAYAKITCFDELVDSDLPEDPYLSKELERYFPTPLRKQYWSPMEHHRLRREIIAGFVTNRMINRLGSTFVYSLQEETGAPAADIARAYTIVWEVFGLRELWTEIAALDNKAPGGTQTAMMIEGGRLITRASLWFLHNRPRPLDIELNIQEFRQGTRALVDELTDLLAGPESETLAASANQFADMGVPETLAFRVVALDTAFSALDIVEVTGSTNLGVQTVGKIYFTLGNRLRLHWLRKELSSLPVDNQWQARAGIALHDDLYALQKSLTSEVLWLGPEIASPETRLKTWFEKSGASVERCMQMFTDLSAQPSRDLAMLSVALRELHNLVQSSASIPLLTDVRSGALTEERSAARPDVELIDLEKKSSWQIVN